MFNGFCIAYMKVNAFLQTLSTQIVLRGLYITRRALQILLRALYITQRALQIFLRTLKITRSALKIFLRTLKITLRTPRITVGASRSFKKPGTGFYVHENGGYGYGGGLYPQQRRGV